METRPRPSKTQRKTDPALTWSPFDWATHLIGVLACLLVLTVPFVPDEKVVRLKMEALEIGVFVLALAVGLKAIFLETPTALKSWATKLNLAVLAWLGVNVLLWSISAEKSLATPELRRVILAGAAFAAFALAGIDDVWKRRIWFAWATAGSLLAVYGLLQTTGGIGSIQVPQMGRVMATYGNPIFFAAFLVPTIFVSVEVFRGASFWGRVLSGAGFLVQVAALYHTQTRAAWLGLAAAGGVAVIARFGFKRVPVWAWLAALVLLGVFVTRTKSVWGRDQGHLLIWRDTLRMWKAHPVAGVGLGAFHTNFPAYAQEDLKSKWPEGKVIINEAHNEYLQTLSETGLMGLLAFLAIPFFFFSRRENWKWPAFGALALLIENIFSVDMRFGVSLATCFLLMGLVSAPVNAPERTEVPVEPVRPMRVVVAAVWLFFLFALLLPRLLLPYKAQREVAATPNFFDQRLLDPAKSIGDLEKLRDQYPTEPAILEKLAYVYAKEIRTRDNKINGAMAEKAVQTYQALVQADPQRVAAYNNLANIHYTLGRTDDALAMWRKATDVKPDFLDAQLNLGKILYTQGKLKESAQRFETVLRYDPNNAEAIVYLKRMVE